ncbi:hypothetical protein GGR41_000517 [Paenalcaligenes hominis]|uniref:RNA polymerase alpha subunit C-terminal domain-containing protein n=2 Tax=Paenalcaligenes hominis TaxID=643674 RepID=A0ABX0WPT1_9BURK|nr:DNA-directed RNA polymerase subunit alpha C-terminal domain-containing protein [Paenalcaligenes hominis]NJB64296.1 hypothetical protein [Paenalcaligenes hominis]GGE68720.1 hypothetical protein GCM10007278_16030 [Paenalcaligenes hominis]
MNSKSILDLGVASLSITHRTYSLLCTENICSVGDLVRFSESQLLRSVGFGRKSLNEVKEALSKLGLRLGMEGPIEKREKSIAADHPDKTLLDEFAIAALPAAMKICQTLEDPDEEYGEFIDRVAETAYELAGAMLKERAKAR